MRSRSDNGQAVVEFALVIPLMALMLFGIVDVGLAINSSISVSNAAREGARLGTTTLDPAQVEARARSVAGDLAATAVTVQVTCRRGGGACPGGLTGGRTGDSIVVSVSYAYRTITPITLGMTIPVRSSAEMRIE